MRKLEKFWTWSHSQHLNKSACTHFFLFKLCSILWNLAPPYLDTSTVQTWQLIILARRNRREMNSSSLHSYYVQPSVEDWKSFAFQFSLIGEQLIPAPIPACRHTIGCKANKIQWILLGVPRLLKQLVDGDFVVMVKGYKVSQRLTAVQRQPPGISVLTWFCLTFLPDKYRTSFYNLFCHRDTCALHSKTSTIIPSKSRARLGASQRNWVQVRPQMGLYGPLYHHQSQRILL